MKKVKLICILGTGFSGSTLLSLVLGAQKNVLNLGEVWTLESDYRINRKCSCGKKVLNITLANVMEDLLEDFSTYCVNLHGDLKFCSFIY